MFFGENNKRERDRDRDPNHEQVWNIPHINDIGNNGLLVLRL